MRIEPNYGYSLEIYDKGNYGTVKRKFFVDMIDLITFTIKSERKNNTSIIDICDETRNTTRYKGCIALFNKKVNEVLMQGNYTILED